MYAVGDAYRLHTKCIQAHKEEKREKFLFYFFFIVRSYIFYCPRFQAFTDPIALIARSFRPAGRMRVPRDAYRRLQTV